MAGPGTYAVTGGLADGVDNATITFRAYYGAAYVDRTFLVTKAKTGSQGNPGVPGVGGAAAVTLSVTRPSFMILTYAEGTPVDTSFTGVEGQLTVLDGVTDVTATAVLSVTTSGCGGSINTSTNTPNAAHAKGYYRINSMSADYATMTITVVYNSATYTIAVTAFKAKGGYEIVGSLPVTNLFEGRIVYLTTDGKLYRAHLGVWTAAVPAVDLTGILTDMQIAAIGKGAALNDDPNLTDPNAWAASAWGPKPTFQTTTAGISGNTEVVSPAGVACSMVGVRGVPLSAGKTYRASCWAYPNAGTNGTLFLRIDLRDSTNTHVGYLTSLIEGVVVTVGGGWQKYAASFTTGYPFVAPVVIMNFGGTAGGLQVQDVRIEEVITGDLIVARTIDASKILTRTLTANEIGVGALTATEIASNTITGNKMSTGVIIAGSGQLADAVIITAKIGLLQVNSAVIQDLTIGTQKIGDNQITRSVSATAAGSAVNGVQLALSYTPDTATNNIRVDWQMLIKSNTFSTTWAASAGSLSVTRVQSGVTTNLTGNLSWSLPGNRTVPDYLVLSGFTVDTVANTINRSYRLNFSGDGASTTVDGVTLLATEMKK